MTELCTVKKVKKRVAYVELERSEKCEGCKGCALFGSRKKRVVAALCDIEVPTGARVVIETPTKISPFASIGVFLFPLLGMILFASVGVAATGGKAPWWVTAILCAAGLAVGLTAVFIIDKIIRRIPGYAPKVLRAAGDGDIQTRQ